jgi:3-oxoacyl-[acyl-carrier-protein] synthase II
MRRRVVITGMGTLSAIGLNIDEFRSALFNGKSGVRTITNFDTTNYTTKIAAELNGFSPDNFFDTKEIRHLDPFAQYAIVTARESISHSGLNFDSLDRNRVGVIIGSGIGGMFSFETEMTKLITQGPRRVSPFFIPQMISDIAAGHISIEFGLKGPNFATVSACASSGHAIGVAMMAIQRGDADIMIAGGSEAAITPMAIAGFNAMKALSTRNDDPSSASRPFDLNRDGFVMGEGSGTIVMEDLEHARSRGAKIWAELAGIGFTADAYHLTAPAPGGEGAVRAMQICIEDGGLRADDVDYINAHGTSTSYNDRNETEAIKTVFGERVNDIAISSTKSMTGHMLGAAGAVELIATTLAVNENKIPPTINYETPDPECDLNYTPNQAVNRQVRAAISNTFGFGGHNACLSIKEYQNN